MPYSTTADASPRDPISPLLKQMTMFSSRASLICASLLELQTEGAAQHDIDCSVVVMPLKSY